LEKKEKREAPLSLLLCFTPGYFFMLIKKKRGIGEKEKREKELF